MSTVLPMFPLGSVVFPMGILPLRIFEPRYRRLLADVLDDDLGFAREFGVVLIERGSEVGGGDLRRPLGTRVRIAQVQQLDDGTFFAVCVGLARIEVKTWLPDSPYPRAEVSDAPDEDDADPGAVDACISALRTCLALRSELGEDLAPATIEFADEPRAALWQACAVAPIGPADDYDLLACDGAAQRVALLRSLIDDEIDVAQQRLAGS